MRVSRTLAMLTAACAVLSLSGCTGSDKAYGGSDFVGGNPAYSMCQVMETENGYYNTAMGLAYYDKATGKALYLCSKPECTHDGSDFCTATFGDMYISSSYMYGDYIYISGAEISENEDLQYKLLRAKNDGTELTEVGTFQKTKGEQMFLEHRNNRQLVIHRDWAVIPFDDFDLPTLMENASLNTMLMNINTGEYKRLPEGDYKVTDTQYGQGSYFPSGEWLYYVIEPKNYINTKHLYRYNFETGITERVDVTPRLTDFAVYDGYIYYTIPAADNEPSKLFRYDITSGENTDISQGLTINGKAPTDLGIKCDGEYILIQDEAHKSPFEGIFFDSEQVTYAISYMQGEKLCEFTVTLEQTGTHEFETKLVNGNIYLCYEYVLMTENGIESVFSGIESALSCPIEDILSGKADWTEAFSFTEVHQDRINDVLEHIEQMEEENAGA